ncbi:MAG TPA: outer membrane protein assembly factor BamD [Candidatus Acidoferrales bacterium]|nr:outer membrane protein assembly factor BamD [Candidatus Acidoferrales bacterium]
MRRAIASLSLFAIALLLCAGSSGCLLFWHKKPQPLAGAKAAPDQVLFDEATNDIKHGRFTVARLTLQTLINTYPDSEYLAKAKLAIADSYYQEGGVTGLTQAVAEYKDFITFFPFLDEAGYAQYRVAMAHYRMMEKPDRDRTQALEAEAELQTMLLKYPKSRWTEEAQQRLRDVQEVIAQGEFEVARFYDLRGAYGAAAARLLELTDRYPLFSQADQANLMLARVYEKTEHNDFAARFYARIVQEYPDSSLAPEAKRRLQAIGFPVPQPDPKAVARTRAELSYAHHRPGMLSEAIGILKSGPDVSRAAHSGDPNLTPETDVVSAREVLSPEVVSQMAGGNSLAPGSAISVERVQPGSAPAGTAASAVGVSATAPGVDGGSSPAATNASQQQMAVEAKTMSDPSKGPKPDQTAAPADITAKAAPAKAGNKELESNKQQSSSKKKKKKGLKKLVPW